MGRGEANTAPEGDRKEARGKACSATTKFADVVIAVCILVALLITGAVVWEYHRLQEVMPSGVLTALFGFWGGELLIIALRQVFGSDVIRGREPEESKKSENESDIFGGSV